MISFEQLFTFYVLPVPVPVPVPVPLTVIQLNGWENGFKAASQAGCLEKVDGIDA